MANLRRRRRDRTRRKHDRARGCLHPLWLIHPSGLVCAHCRSRMQERTENQRRVAAWVRAAVSDVVAASGIRPNKMWMGEVKAQEVKRIRRGEAELAEKRGREAHTTGDPSHFTLSP